jgi:hypothetical protein
MFMSKSNLKVGITDFPICAITIYNFSTEFSATAISSISPAGFNISQDVLVSYDYKF